MSNERQPPSSFRVVGPSYKDHRPSTWYLPTLEKAKGFAETLAQDVWEEYDVLQYIGTMRRKALPPNAVEWVEANGSQPVHDAGVGATVEIPINDAAFILEFAEVCKADQFEWRRLLPVLDRLQHAIKKSSATGNSTAAAQCQGCGAPETTRTLKMFLGKLLCSDCEDAFCYSIEH